MNDFGWSWEWRRQHGAEARRVDDNDYYYYWLAWLAYGIDTLTLQAMNDTRLIFPESAAIQRNTCLL